MIYPVKAIKYYPYKGEKAVSFFISNRRQIANPLKYSCFVRRIGVSGSDSSWSDFITCLDCEFASCGVPYIRVSSLSEPVSPADAKRFSELYDGFISGRGLPLAAANKAISMTIEQAFAAAVGELSAAAKASEETARRNFGIKLIRFAEKTLLPMMNGSEFFPKIVFVGDIKPQEYLTLFFAAGMGCDVLYINPAQDVPSGRELSAAELFPERRRITAPPVPPAARISRDNPSFSDCIVRDVESNARRTPPDANPTVGSVPSESTHAAALGAEPQSAAAVRPAISAAAIRRPDRHTAQTNAAVKAQPQTSSTSVYQPVTSASVRSPAAGVRQETAVNSADGLREMSYEELAALSESVVMITLRDAVGTAVGSGSGVVISESGFILTNLHVAANGSSYRVRFENDEQEYAASGIVKYNQRLDLAVIGVDRRCVPIKPYLGNKLARGQRVVAIGSPLGLFNTVSDGIISAFRTRGNGTRMIQFTAPISSGSSGGAVLDMYGRLIGISTAGFDEAQNINLAVDISEVHAFAGNFFTTTAR